MSERRVSRKTMLRVSGGVVAAGILGGGLAEPVGAEALSSGDVELGVVTSTSGHTVDVRTSSGGRVVGSSAGRRPLRPGDRVAVERGAEQGALSVSPLYSSVEGTVETVGRGNVVVGDQVCAVDGLSVARNIRNGDWVDVGSVAANVKPGMAVGALCITNEYSNRTTVDVAFIL
jgi:hypothetical protein